MFICFFVRMLAHYLAVYLTVLLTSRPISAIRVGAFRVDIVYNEDTAPFHTQFLATLVAPAYCVLLVLVLCVAVDISLGPGWLYREVGCFGIVATLDPLLVLCVD